MSGVVDLALSDSDSDSDNDTHNNLNESESDETDDPDRLYEKRRIKPLELDLDIMRLKMVAARKEPHNKACRRSNISKISTRNPKVSEKKKKCKRKYCVGSSDFVHVEQNTRKILSVIDNM